MRTWMQTTVAAATLMGLIAAAGHARGAEPWTVVVSPDNSFSTLLAKDGRAILEAQIVTWGPNWAWVGSPSSRERAVDGVLKISGSMKFSGETVTMACEAQQSGEQTVTYKYELTAEKDAPLTTLLNSLSVNSSVAGEIAAVNVLDHDGQRTDKTLDVSNGTFAIDGARDKALYYEVVFK